jgi:NADH dehydrogenase FAD-containing subunit
MTGQRIVILGGGYGGQMAAARLASRCPAAVITVVDASPVFVERIRLHQVAAGEHVRERPMADMLPKHVGFVQGRVVSWEPRRRLVRVGSGPRELAYDWCVYALGSRVDVDVVPGAREHAFALDDPAGAKRLAAATVCGGRVVVVGAGLTGIEAAIELAERRRGLAVTLVAGGVLGADLSSAGARHVRDVMARVGVVVREHARVGAVERDAAVLADGERLPFDACLWSAGFTAAPLAREAGLGVDALGRVRVAPTLQVPGYPEVFAVGDVAAVEGPDGRSLRMACATAMPMGVHAAEGIARAVAGATPRPFRFGYAIRCVSLGRRSGLVQQVDEADRAVERALTGRAGAIVKELVCRSTVLSIRAEARLRLPFYRWPRPKPARPSLPAAAPAGE